MTKEINELVSRLGSETAFTPKARKIFDLDLLGIQMSFRDFKPIITSFSPDTAFGRPQEKIIDPNLIFGPLLKINSALMVKKSKEMPLAILLTGDRFMRNPQLPPQQPEGYSLEERFLYVVDVTPPDISLEVDPGFIITHIPKLKTVLYDSPKTLFPNNSGKERLAKDALVLVQNNPQEFYLSLADSYSLLL